MSIDLAEFRPRYNIAPSQIACSFALEPEGKISASWRRWGLLPPWSRDLKSGYSMINARSESVLEKKSFRSPLERRRCLILADGFYEWIREGKKKLPVWFTLGSDEPFMMAGLWEPPPPHLSPGDAAKVPAAGTFAILTTSANSTVAAVHDRMPVILPEETWARWLDSTVSASIAAELLTPMDGSLMKSRPANPIVNSVANDSPECISPEQELF